MNIPNMFKRQLFHRKLFLETLNSRNRRVHDNVHLLDAAVDATEAHLLVRPDNLIEDDFKVVPEDAPANEREEQLRALVEARREVRPHVRPPEQEPFLLHDPLDSGVGPSGVALPEVQRGAEHLADLVRLLDDFHHPPGAHAELDLEPRVEAHLHAPEEVAVVGAVLLGEGRLGPIHRHVPVADGEVVAEVLEHVDLVGLCLGPFIGGLVFVEKGGVHSGDGSGSGGN